jgi:Flp pilus assembly pilin Flp
MPRREGYGAPAHDVTATFLTKVTRWMVVPVGQADRVGRQMLHRLPSVFGRLVRNQQGVTVVEYSLLVALLSVAAVAALNNLGQTIQNILTNATNAMS